MKTVLKTLSYLISLQIFNILKFIVARYLSAMSLAILKREK